MRALAMVFSLPVLLLASSVAATAQEADVEGSSDHSLISRIPGSVIRHYDQRAYDEHMLLLGPRMVREDPERTSVAGRVTRISYRLPSDGSTLQAVRMHQRAMERAGFSILYQCDRSEECGTWFARYYFASPGESFESISYSDDDARYLAAQLPGPDGTVYVSIYAYERSGNEPFIEARLRIVESEDLEELTVNVDARTIARELEASGHIALSGILFDTDQAVLKPESDRVLQEMATYLGEDSALTTFVVGHTDNVGDYEHNTNLSQRRAEAVVEALTSRFAIDPGRLQAVGVGATAPVATNRTDAGRAQNRRVELVAR